MEQMTQAQTILPFKAALDGLCAKDSDFAGARAKWGDPPDRFMAQNYASLARIILGQQISRAVATTLWSRLEDKGWVDAPSLASLDYVDLQHIGISGRKSSSGAGHSALGGWASLALILLPTCLAITGSFSSDDILFDGPLAHLAYERIQETTRLHHRLGNILFVLIGLHLLAMLVYGFWLRHNLVPTMIHGRSQYADKPVQLVSSARRAVGLVLMIILVAGCHFLPLLRPAYF